MNAPLLARLDHAFREDSSRYVSARWKEGEWVGDVFKKIRKIRLRKLFEWKSWRIALGTIPVPANDD